jgi:ribosome-associated translation inhibitor RaiA
MLIQINTDKNIQGDERTTNYFSSMLSGTLDRFSEHITRIEVHLSDENSERGGLDDKRCMLEARVKGLQPIAVTHKAESLELAVSGAADRMKNALETTINKMRAH